MEKHLRSRSDSCGFHPVGKFAAAFEQLPSQLWSPAIPGSYKQQELSPGLHFSRFRLIIFNFLCPNRAFCVSSRASSYNFVYTLGLSKKLKEKHKQTIGLYIYDLGCY